MISAQGGNRFLEAGFTSGKKLIIARRHHVPGRLQQFQVAQDFVGGHQATEPLQEFFLEKGPGDPVDGQRAVLQGFEDGAAAIDVMRDQLDRSSGAIHSTALK
jgi:hypothetical protein